jgi:hypothetical protein
VARSACMNACRPRLAGTTALREPNPHGVTGSQVLVARGIDPITATA